MLAPQEHPNIHDITDAIAWNLGSPTGFIAAFCGLAWAVGDPADHRSGR